MNYSLICCLGSSDSDCWSNFYSYCLDSFYFFCMMSFVIYCWNSVYSLGLNGNWMQKQILLCWNSIVNSYFYFGYFDYSIDCTYFVRNFVNFFVWAIYLINWSYMVIDFLNDLSCLGVVFQSYYYCVFSCLVGFDLFSYIDRIIYLVLCAFEVYSDYLVVFVYIRKYYVGIVGNNYTIFRKMVCF